MGSGESLAFFVFWHCERTNEKARDRRRLRANYYLVRNYGFSVRRHDRTWERCHNQLHAGRPGEAVGKPVRPLVKIKQQPSAYPRNHSSDYFMSKRGLIYL